MACAHCSASTCLPKLVTHQSLSTNACVPTQARLLKLCTSHIHVQHVHHCSSQHTLHHEADSIPRHTAGIHAHAGCCQASLCSFHQVGLASYVPPTCHNGTPWVLDQAAHAQVSPHLHNSSSNMNLNNNNNSNNDYDTGNDDDKKSDNKSESDTNETGVKIMISVMITKMMIIMVIVILTTHFCRCSTCEAKLLSCQAGLIWKVRRSDAQSCNAQHQLLSLWVQLL